jgi:cell division protein FtsL
MMNARLVYTTLFISISILAAGQVWLSHLRIETSQHASVLQQDIAKQHEKIQVLGLEYASLARPNRLRQLAHSKLGMQAPRPMQVVQP